MARRRSCHESSTCYIFILILVDFSERVRPRVLKPLLECLASERGTTMSCMCVPCAATSLPFAHIAAMSALTVCGGELPAMLALGGGTSVHLLGCAASTRTCDERRAGCGLRHPKRRAARSARCALGVCVATLGVLSGVRGPPCARLCRHSAPACPPSSPLSPAFARSAAVLLSRSMSATPSMSLSF